MTSDLRSLPPVVADVVETALGRVHRDDPVVGRSGGPAGNARLTAWIGLLLLVAFVVECATLLNLWQLMTMHIVVGVLLVGLVLAKTATTGWRIVRYYLGNPAYREAGPPPLLLRLLGPLVVLGGLAVLGTGLALVALGAGGSRNTLFSVPGVGVDAVALHKIAFVFWFGVTAPHTLLRLVPAWRLTLGRGGSAKPRGGLRRVTAVAVIVAAGAIAAGPVLGEAGEWLHHRPEGPEGLARPAFSLLR